MNRRVVSNELFFIEAEKELQNGNRITVLVDGQSMFPFIRGGRDQVVIDPFVAKKPQIGDVCLFRYQGHYCIHRCVDRCDDGQLEMLGDGNIVSEFVLCKDILGRVTAIKYFDGTVLPVSSIKWRLPSWVWQKTRFIRGRLLRGIRRLK